jgi:hypothetical protein
MDGAVPRDAYPSDGLVDAGVHFDASDGGGEVRCDSDLAGVWMRMDVHAPGECAPLPDMPFELGATGLPAVAEESCESAGCSLTNCSLRPAESPDCVATLRYETPCTGLPRGTAFEMVHRVITGHRIEGFAVLHTTRGDCTQHYVLTR